jgi:hypothetical protein
MLLKQSQLVIDVIQDAKIDPKYLHKSIWNQCSNRNIAPKKKTLIFATIPPYITFLKLPQLHDKATTP